MNIQMKNPFIDRIHIFYDKVSGAVGIDENDFTAFEALGILEAAKAMIIDNWLRKDEPEK